VKIKGIGETILRFRRAVGVILVAATLYMSWWAAEVRIATRFIDFFPHQHHNVVLSERFGRFGGNETLVVMVQVRKGDIFNAATLKKIQKLTQEVDGLPGVNHYEVLSLSSFRTVYAQLVTGGIDLRPFMYPSIPERPEEIVALKRKISAHRGPLRHLVSEDNKSTVITATLKEPFTDHADFVRALRRIVANNRDNDHDIYVTGESVVRGYGHYYLPALAAILVTACGAIVFALYATLGSYWDWWVPLLTASGTAVWGLGFMGWIGYSFDPLMLVVPFILTARNISHAVAWQRRYYRTFDELEDCRAACAATIDAALMPGLVAIAADVTGIVFVSFSGIPVLDHAARAGVVWLGAGLPMIYILQPVVVSYLGAPANVRGFEHGRKLSRRAEPLVDRIVEVPVTAGALRKLTLAGALALLIVGVVSAINVEVGYTEPGTPLYRRESRVNRDAGAIARKFPADEAWVLFSTPPFPHSQSVLAPEVLRLADDLRSHLLKDSGVIQVLSFASSVIRPFNQIFHYGHPKYFGIPNNVQEAGNLWYLFASRSAPGGMQRYIVDSDAKDTCIRVLLRDHTAATLARVQHEIKEFLKSYTDRNPAYARVEVNYMAGVAGLYAAADEVLYRVGLINIVMVLGCVYILCTVLFRSFVAGMLLVLSSVLANFAAFTYLYLFGIQLTIDTLPVISLAIGLGIDHAITVVSRVHAEVAAGHGLDDAIRISLSRGGAGALGAACAMIGGIVPWMFSPALFHHQMAVLLTILLAANLLASLWVLPAVISSLAPRFISSAMGAAPGAGATVASTAA